MESKEVHTGSWEWVRYYKRTCAAVCFPLVALLIVVMQDQVAYGQAAQTPRTPKMPELPAQLMPPHPPAKMGKRYYDIDAKRQVNSIESEDALPRSREFKRIDSTYYVGWMYEGVYKYNHAADYLGFKHAIQPLERAMQLLEHDYRRALATRTSDLITYYPVRVFQIDYTTLAYYLVHCYSNTEQPEKAYALLRRVLKWNFQRQYYMDTYNYLAWTVHRNRFYTSAKYPFLKNSIEENEQLANRYLDTALMTIERNIPLNAKIFQPGYVESERMGVYHYKNIIYSYAFNIDSANYYFDLMREGGRLPHNNYATFRAVCGDFRTAEEEYKIASRLDMGDKRLQEWAYYTSILDIYKAQPKVGAALARDMVRSAGSTPGYGWYNIALARCMLYDGQIGEAQRYADKAAEFKELHIGTTLGQSHYDFSIQLLKLINKEQSWQMEQFENRNWWYNPATLMRMSQKLSEKYLQQFLIINQFAQNPERDRVIYKLFSNESTVSWDEIYYLVHDFSTRFFVKRFQKEAFTDKRRYVRKYFALVAARLQLQEGNYTEARRTLTDLLKDPDIDQEYEKLFLARTYQGLAQCAKEQKDGNAYNSWMNKLFEAYPQLVPFTGLQANMKLTLSGEIDPEVAQGLRDCNINWVTDNSIPAPHAYVLFSKNGAKKSITYYVLDSRGKNLVQKQSFGWQKPNETAKKLAYRLFDVGGNDLQPPAAKEQTNSNPSGAI